MKEIKKEKNGFGDISEELACQVRPVKEVISLTTYA